MKNGRVGIAILGAGAIADVHVQACLASPDLCEVLAVCDRFPEKARQLVSAHRLNADTPEDVRQVLLREDIDAVSICLPPSEHAWTAVAALNAGKHVLCEKPMAGSLEECDAMIGAARENGRLLGVVAQNRYKTPNQKVKRLLEEGAIGPVRFAVVNSLWWRGENYYDLWWRGTWEKESGGCTANHAVHHIDLLQWMLGMPESVQAVVANVGHHNSECEDLAVAVLRYPGAIAEITASLVTHDEAQELIFQGERAGISVPWQVHAQRPLPNGFPEEAGDVAEEIQKRYDGLPALEVEGHPAQIRNFLRAIRGEEALLIDGKQGRNTIELITAIYKASAEGVSVSLPLSANDPFYRKGGIAARMPHFHTKTRSVDNFAATKPITLGRDVGK